MILKCLHVFYGGLQKKFHHLTRVFWGATCKQG